MTDVQLVHYLRAFLASDDKPKNLSPIDLLQVVRFLLQLADEKDCYVSQETLAAQLCVSADAIARSQQRLKKAGWLIVRKGGYRGRSNRYEIVLNKLPQDDLLRTVVSQDAKRLAAGYGKALQVQTHKKFMKGWQQQWAFQVQWLIDRTRGDHDEVREIINFALNQPKYVKAAQRGPYALRKIWNALLVDYNAEMEYAWKEISDPERIALRSSGQKPAQA